MFEENAASLFSIIDLLFLINIYLIEYQCMDSTLLYLSIFSIKVSSLLNGLPHDAFTFASSQLSLSPQKVFPASSGSSQIPLFPMLGLPSFLSLLRDWGWYNHVTARERHARALWILSAWTSPLPADMSLSLHGFLEYFSGTPSGPDHLPLVVPSFSTASVYLQTSANSLVFLAPICLLVKARGTFQNPYDQDCHHYLTSHINKESSNMVFFPQCSKQWWGKIGLFFGLFLAGCIY